MRRRLSEIKAAHAYNKKTGKVTDATLHPRDIDWLIEQVEQLKYENQKLEAFKYHVGLTVSEDKIKSFENLADIFLTIKAFEEENL